jgi:L-2-hydroxyglutarate oxidase LhgO
VLAFAREGYTRLTFNPSDLIEVFAYRGFRTLAAKYWRTGWDEMRRDFSKVGFLGALRRYMPDLVEDDLIPGPSGVRAQALGADGKLVDDFVIHQDKNVMHVRNAPSPAATSSLAIAEYVANQAAAAFDFDSAGARLNPGVTPQQGA